MPFSIVRNDLRKVEAEALVLPSNSSLKLSGGVGLQVALEAGLDELQGYLDAIGACPVGSCVSTPACDLNSRILIHAVGPIWKKDVDNKANEQLLQKTYESVFDEAVKRECSSIALPLISAGTYGFPVEKALEIARESIRQFVDQNDSVDVILVVYEDEAFDAASSRFDEVRSFINSQYVSNNVFSYAERDEPKRSTGIKKSPEHFGAAPRVLRQVKEALPFVHAAECAPKEAVNFEEWHKETTAPFGERCKEEEILSEEGFKEEPARSKNSPWICSCGNWNPGCAFCIKCGKKQELSPQDLTTLMASLDASFSETLVQLIDEKGLTDPEVYKRANMSRQLFSKIRSNKGYQPKKTTAVSLCLALNLNLEETQNLLQRAGLILNNSSMFDVIIRYFISKEIYDYFVINETLFAFDCPLLGG